MSARRRTCAGSAACNRTSRIDPSENNCVCRAPESGRCAERRVRSLRGCCRKRRGCRRSRRNCGHPGDAGCRHTAFVFEALTAEDRPALRGFEGNGRRDAAFGAFGARLGARDTRRCRSCAWRRRLSAMSATRLARLATLGVVLELLVLEEKLLARGKDEFAAAVDAGKNPVYVFHCRISRSYGTLLRP